mmetsp:Transcript_19104/g.34758  ORF Transcript_19104/g.34758 Transcript_19104/m.34758 type:complete len:161 (-) Transcript_19104:3488-3970(-)
MKPRGIVGAEVSLIPIPGAPFPVYLTGERGARRSHAKLKVYGILSLGFKNIISNFPHRNNPERYRVIEVVDLPRFDFRPKFLEAVAFLDSCLGHGPVIVHCTMGISRSSTTLIAYLIWKCRWSLQQSLKYIQDLRPCVEPNPGFLHQLSVWEREVLHNPS